MMHKSYLFEHLSLDPKGEIHTHPESKARGNFNFGLHFLKKLHGCAPITSLPWHACFLVVLVARQYH